MGIMSEINIGIENSLVLRYLLNGITNLEKRFTEYVQQHDKEFIELQQDAATRIKSLEEEFERMSNERKALNHRFTKLEDSIDTIDFCTGENLSSICNIVASVKKLEEQMKDTVRKFTPEEYKEIKARMKSIQDRLDRR